MPRTVLFLHSSAGRYGADLQLLALAGGLDRERYRPVAVLPERGELAGLLEEAKVEVVIHPLAVARRAELSPRGLARTARRRLRDRSVLARLARERRVAVVHSNTSVVLSGGEGARAAGASHVVHLREIYYGGAERLWPLVRRRLGRADAVLCISEAVAAQLGGAANVSVLRDGLPGIPERVPRQEARAELGIPRDAFAVALLGRVSDWKGQDVLARALAEPALAEIGAVGLVAGDAWPGNERLEDELAALGTHLGLGERLRLLGFRRDVENVLGAADAVAVPSTRPEPLGLVAVEAAAAGLPVVASAAGGLPEVVKDGETGLLVEPGSAASLAAALRSLADDEAMARTLGEAASSDARARFGRERMIAEVQAVYDRLTGGGRLTRGS